MQYLKHMVEDDVLFTNSNPLHIETGSYKGFLPTAMQYLKKQHSIHESNILPWQVYTPKDMSLQLSKSIKTTTGTKK